jgi:hypothetical protein
LKNARLSDCYNPSPFRRVLFFNPAQAVTPDALRLTREPVADEVGASNPQAQDAAGVLSWAHSLSLQRKQRGLGPGNNQDLALNVFPVSTPLRPSLSKHGLYVIYHIEGGMNHDIQVANSCRSRFNSRIVGMRKYVREQYDLRPTKLWKSSSSEHSLELMELCRLP